MGMEPLDELMRNVFGVGYRIMDADEQEAFERTMREPLPDGLRIVSAGVIRGGNPWSDTVPCPYCSRPVERVVKPSEVEWAGEHCFNCHLPFGIDENGDAYGQDDPRWI